jgi:colanic acid/amylovoran biosynthesis glycosyltransferase
MKIAIVVGSFPAISETFIVNQLTYLIENGYDVTILSKHKGDISVVHKAVTDYQLINKTIYFNYPEKNYLKRILQLLRILYKSPRINWRGMLKQILKLEDLRQNINLWSFFKYQFTLFHSFDLYHVHWANNALDIVDAKAKSLINTPVVVTFHGYDIVPVKVEEYKKLYNKFQNNVNLITVNTHYTLNLVQNVFKKTIDIALLPVSLDTNFFLPASNKINNETIKIIYIGRLIDLKGPDLAIKIVGKLLHQTQIKNIKLSIIGDGEMKIMLQEMIKSEKLDAFVEMHGAQKQEEVIKELQQSDIFLLPGITNPDDMRAETQGLVIQEAQSMKIPVVVSDAGGMKYGLINGETGFVVKEGDIDGFVNKLEALIISKEMRTLFGERGREFVVKNYDKEVLGQRLLNLYNELWKRY